MRDQRFFDVRLRGTFAPERRASERPMAMACLRLVTFLPERPERSVPRFRSCIARFTLLLAAVLYFRLRDLVVAIFSSREGCSNFQAAWGPGPQ